MLPCRASPSCPECAIAVVAGVLPVEPVVRNPRHAACGVYRAAVYCLGRIEPWSRVGIFDPSEPCELVCRSDHRVCRLLVTGFGDAIPRNMVLCRDPRLRLDRRVVSSHGGETTWIYNRLGTCHRCECCQRRRSDPHGCLCARCCRERSSLDAGTAGIPGSTDGDTWRDEPGDYCVWCLAASRNAVGGTSRRGRRWYSYRQRERFVRHRRLNCRFSRLTPRSQRGPL